MLIEAFDAFGFEAGGQDEGQPVHTLSDTLQAFRAMVNRVEASNVGQQHLGRADVGVGLFAADMLLAGLQGHAQGGIATGIA
ncbi:hypothetical protein D3C78_1879300 [compost metagenome]